MERRPAAIWRAAGARRALPGPRPLVPDKTRYVADAVDYQLSAQERDGAATIAIRGRVAVGNAQRLLNGIAARLPPHPPEVQLDLSGVEYFDSGGGAVLIRLRQQLAAQGAGLRIMRSTPDIDGFLSLVDEAAVLRPLPPP